jgi:hypothetical protein
MTTTLFDYNVLNFLYLLSKHQKVMNSLEISKYLQQLGYNIVDRTVRRRFKFLKDNPDDCTDYFSHVKFESVGLVQVHVFFSNLNEIFLDTLPNLSYVFFSSYNFKEYCYTCYLVPKEQLDDFKDFLSSYKGKLFEDMELIIANKTINIYSPFHEILDRSGNINFPKEGIDNSYFIEMMRQRLADEQDTVHPAIAKCPLLVPILLESFREHWTAAEIWSAIKDKMGENIWNCIYSLRRRSIRTDTIGIKLVQDLRKFLKDNSDKFYQQTRIYYSPFFSKDNVSAYLLLDLADPKDLLKLAKEVSEHCVESIFYPSASLSEDNTIILFTLTSHKEYNHILHDLLPKYLRQGGKSKTFAMNHNKTKKFWNRKYMKADYSKFFDPDTCSLKLDIDKYRHEVDELLINSEEIKK